jgi:invasion protein IalB
MSIASKIVRSVMRSYDIDSRKIWSNNYDHCQTVKCYAPGDDEDALDLAMEIQEALNAVAIEHSMSVITYPSERSLIVRVPN